ncbi:hypothetical protein BGZ59_000324 [Podila verticillata]|nr:hypothetical protein BGZ59_000324 [Podila verticillata]
MATRDIMSCSSTPTEHALPPSPPALSVSTDVNSSTELLKPPPSAIASLLATVPISPVATPDLLEDTMSPTKGHEPAQENIETVEEIPTAQENELVKENESDKDDGLTEGEMGFSHANLAEFRLPVDVLLAREHPAPNRYKRRLIVESDDDEQPSLAPSSLSPPLQCLQQPPQENNSGALQNDTYAKPQASSVSTIDQDMVGMVARQTRASPDDVKIKAEPDLDRPLLRAIGSRKRPGRVYVEAVEVPPMERVKRIRAIPPKEDPKLLADLGWALETTMRPHSKSSAPIAGGPQNLGIPSQLVLKPPSSTVEDRRDNHSSEKDKDKHNVVIDKGTWRDVRVDTSAKSASLSMVSPLSLSSSASVAARGVLADIFLPHSTSHFISTSGNETSQPASTSARQAFSSTQLPSRQPQNSDHIFATLVQKPGSTSALKDRPTASGSILGTGSNLAVRPDNTRKTFGPHSTFTPFHQRSQQPKANSRPSLQQQLSNTMSNSGNNNNNNNSFNKNNEPKPTIGRVNMMFKRD